MLPWTYSVTYAVPQPPQAVAIDRVLVFEVVLTNTGEQAWPKAGDSDTTINVSYHWRDAAGQDLLFDGQRTPLHTAVAPGEQITVALRVLPPPVVGPAQLLIDLVKEGETWFSWKDIAPYEMPITITPSLGLPKVCLINTGCVLNDAIGNNLRDKLRFFNERGYHVHALVESYDPRLPIAEQALLTELSIYEMHVGGTTPEIRYALDHFHGSDLYIFDYPINYPLIESMRLVRRGTIIFDYHGVTPPELWPDPDTRHLLIEGQQHVSMVQYADYAIAHSRFTAAELVATGLIPPERVTVMPYVVPLDEFQPAERDRELVARYGLEDALVLLYVGRMAGNKRIVDMVEALAVVRQEFPNTVLLLAGNYSARFYQLVFQEATARAAALGCAEQVIFLGPVAHTELHRYYNTADVYVTASQHEGFCVPVIEAMACGKPVVGTNITALPDTIGPGGLLFEPGDIQDLAAQLLRLLRDRIAERKLGPAQPAEPFAPQPTLIGER